MEIWNISLFDALYLFANYLMLSKASPPYQYRAFQATLTTRGAKGKPFSSISAKIHCICWNLLLLAYVVIAVFLAQLVLLQTSSRVLSHIYQK